MEIAGQLVKQTQNELLLKNIDKNQANFWDLGKKGANYNVSSIAIKKILLLKNEKILSQVVAIDYYMFYSAFLSQYDIMISPKVLTVYTLHQSESHIQSKKIDDYYNKLENRVIKVKESLCNFLKMTKDTPYFIFPEMEIFNCNVKLYMCNGKKYKISMSYVINNAINLLKYNKISSFELLIYYFIFTIFPNYSKYLFFKIEIKNMQRYQT